MAWTGNDVSASLDHIHRLDGTDASNMTAIFLRIGGANTVLRFPT
jgi:hypothetical protein